MRTRPLDATGATKPAGRVSGALFPSTLPLGEGPQQGHRRRIGVRCRGAPPAWGSRGAQPLARQRSEQKPSAEGEHFLLFGFAFSSSSGPKRGLIYRYRRGKAKARSGAGLRGLIVVSPDNKVVSPDNSGVMGMTRNRKLGQIDKDTGEILDDGFIAYVVPKRKNRFEEVVGDVSGRDAVALKSLWAIWRRAGWVSVSFKCSCAYWATSITKTTS